MIEGEGDEWDGDFMSRLVGAWDSVRQVRKVGVRLDWGLGYWEVLG